MASVEVYSADKIDEITDAGVVDASVTGGNLVLERRDGGTVDVGPVVTELVDATTTTQGVVELATDTETIDGTDADRAVTPLALAALTGTTARRGLLELATSAEAIAGTDTARAITPAALLAARVISDPGQSAVPSSYPPGTSITEVASGWTPNGGVGIVQTVNVDNSPAAQTFYGNSGGTEYPRIWFRQYHVSGGGGGWTAWQEGVLLNALTAGSFTQATAFTSYPLGYSRLYYTTANSTSWDFTGKAGEVETFREGTDFARQRFTEHKGGSTTTPDVWVRTANAASGWSGWTRVTGRQPYAQLCGVVNITPSAANVVTSEAVSFPAGYFTQTPIVVVGLNSVVPGSEVSGWSGSGASTTGFTAYVRRGNTTATNLHWIATQQSP